MKSYQFIILFGSAFGILFNGLALLLSLVSPSEGSFYLSQTYLLGIIMALYITNILVVFFISNSRIVGLFSIGSAVFIAMFLIPLPPGLPVAAVLMAGGILALIRKPYKNPVNK